MGWHPAQPRQGLSVGTEGAVEKCRSVGTQLERTVCSDLLLPEPELCQVWCQSARERCFLLRAWLCLRELHPQRQIRRRSLGDPCRSRPGRSLQIKAGLDGALRNIGVPAHGK